MFGMSYENIFSPLTPCEIVKNISYAENLRFGVFCNEIFFKNEDFTVFSYIILKKQVSLPSLLSLVLVV